MNAKNLKIAFLFLTFFVAGFITSHYLIQEDTIKDRLIPTRQSGFKFTNPLLECEPDNESITFKELAPSKTKLESKIEEIKKSGQASFVAVYFRDLNNGPWIGIGEREIFSPASLLKVPIMIAYFKAAEFDPTILEDKLTFKMPKDIDGKSLIKEPVTLTEGLEYSVLELIEIMIQKSDNAAAELLNNHINPKIVSGVYNDLGVPIPEDPNNEAVINVRQYSSFFRILFNASYLSRNYSEKALSILAKTDFNAGLLKGVPGSIEVAHKYGERVASNSFQLHDCGIVYYPNEPYLICVMTKGNDLTKLPDVIGQISKLVYEEIDTKLKI